MSNHLSCEHLAQLSCCSGGARNKNRNDSTPTISVVIPTYNRATIVLKAIRSVFRQTFQDLEIIVVDDGSDDQTCQRILALRDARITILRHQENKGAAAARNTGVAAAKGKYIAVLDADEWVANQRHLLNLLYSYQEQLASVRDTLKRNLTLLRERARN